ncbi:DUF89 protein CxxC subfamily [hydrothermal vent metagenome]|uniref:DUF89 protein CxxC subfamily n=1 Tax=hydrothermal vent metagenome TaxID=652676 RepID=A0A3B0V9M2_9ZZZZ
MRTSLECLVCFMRQALVAARLSSQDPEVQRRVMDEVGRLLAALDLDRSAPENAVGVYRLIADITGVRDPYAELRKTSNEFALGLRDAVRQQVESAADPLYTALRFAVAGNIIDYGAGHGFDAAATMAGCLEQKPLIDDFVALERDLERGPDILYLADNSGEIVFDGLLIEQLQARGCKVTLAVRGDIILNDVTLRDVKECGLDRLCPVITNGTGCPGTPLDSCSPEFRKRFAGADLIMSKGQGNFETLSEVAAPIYFLLTVKCSLVARCIAETKGLAPELVTGDGEIVLMKQVQGRDYCIIT